MQWFAYIRHNTLNVDKLLLEYRTMAITKENDAISKENEP